MKWNYMKSCGASSGGTTLQPETFVSGFLFYRVMTSIQIAILSLPNESVRLHHRRPRPRRTFLL